MCMCGEGARRFSCHRGVRWLGRGGGYLLGFFSPLKHRLAAASQQQQQILPPFSCGGVGSGVFHHREQAAEYCCVTSGAPAVKPGSEPGLVRYQGGGVCQ